jgi:hypothetical protein
MLVVGFKGWTWFKKSRIDNLNFRLHYRYTFAILWIASLLTAAKQYLGDPIDCIVDGAGMANGVVGPPFRQHTNFFVGAPESKKNTRKINKAKPISFIIRCVEDLLLEPWYLHPPISTHR